MIEAEKKGCEGVVSLEACIIVPVFFFLIMFLYGIIMTFSVRSNMTHALLEATKSMSMDKYTPDKLGDTEAIPESLSQALYTLFSSKRSNGDNFASTMDWTAHQDRLNGLAKKRVYAYLSGNSQENFDVYDESASEEYVDKLIKASGIQNLDISATVENDGKDIVIVAKYKIKYLFDMNGKISPEFQQSARSRIWTIS